MSLLKIVFIAVEILLLLAASNLRSVRPALAKLPVRMRKR
jgi:hypothetical protein